MLTITIATALYLLFGVWALLLGKVLVADTESKWKRRLFPLLVWITWPLIILALLIILAYIIVKK